MSLPCPINDLIPQKGKMGFSQTLVQAKANESESTAFIDQNNIFLDDRNQLSEVVLIEYLNQLIAGVHGYNGKYLNKPAQKGLFVGLQEAEFIQAVHSGDLITIKGFVTEEVSQVTFIQGAIYRDAKKIAQLITKLYEVKDTTEFDALTDRGQIFRAKKAIGLNDLKPPTYLVSSLHRKLYSYLQDTQIGEDFISFKITCPDDFDAFDGHFPGNPILPGIIFLEIAKLALELFMNKPVSIKSIKKMKISGMVLPNQAISCTLNIDKANGSVVSFSALFKEGAQREISRFSGSFDEENER